MKDDKLQAAYGLVGLLAERMSCQGHSVQGSQIVSGEYDNELLKVSHAYGLYRDLAKYMWERQGLELWGKVLNREEGTEDEEDPHRRQLSYQVVEGALSESTNTDEVSCTVQAFMAADLPSERINWLERICLAKVGLF